MGSFSLIHWLILGVVILLLFGGNRFSSMMSDVAKGLKSFKQGLSEDDQPETPERRPSDQQQRVLPADKPIDITPVSREPSTTTPPPPPPAASDDQRR